ncbi:hypothetical protein M0812_25931 [Anaeramoeba flamelloides]|uniref:BZIP domain-containing protein n=1 Tax=Anaeramoeba flamelloides TaxID=1746091 RepID=A0AAV7YI08_9EUKA|nr:hypothetical protein M0812_25931 [Anaeramoeba flamelloides]
MTFTSTPCIRKRAMYNSGNEDTDLKKRRFLRARSKQTENQKRMDLNRKKENLQRRSSKVQKSNINKKGENCRGFQKENLQAQELQSKLGTLQSEFEALQTKVEVKIDENSRLNEELAQLRLILEQNGHSYQEIYGGDLQTDSALFVTMNRKAKPQKQILEIPLREYPDLLENKFQNDQLDVDLLDSSEIESDLEYEMDEHFQMKDQKQEKQHKRKQDLGDQESSELQFFEIKRFQTKTQKKKTTIITNF